MKRILSLLLAVLMVCSVFAGLGITVSAEDSLNSNEKKFIVVGDKALTGASWDPTKNPMAEGEYTFNGKTYDFSITFPDVPVGTYRFKVTDENWGNTWGCEKYDYLFIVAACDVTIYFNSETKEIDVEADGLGYFELKSITAVGNGEGAWLNGAIWDTEDTSNDMTEVLPGIWEITYKNVKANDNYNVKFVCNHSWAPYNWSFDGELDGQEHRSLVVKEDGSTVTLRLDVSGFNFATGTGIVLPEFFVASPSEVAFYGDADGDGRISINDATKVQRACLKMVSVDNEICDVNSDGSVDINDVTYIQKYLVGGYINIGRVGKSLPAYIKRESA